MALTAETVDLYAEAETQVRDVLIRYRRTRALSQRTAAIRLEPDAGTHTPDPIRKSVPSDRLCWTLDVERLLLGLNDPSSRLFVHRHASQILLGDLVEGMKHRDLRRIAGPCDVNDVVTRSVSMFFAHYMQVASDYLPAA